MISIMEQEQDSLLYSLSAGLKGKSASVQGRQYVAHMKSMGTFDDDALQTAMAAELGKDADYVRYVESVRRKVITAALREGKRVYAGGMVLHPVVKGPFESIDGTFDPKRNRVDVTGYAYGEFQACLRDSVPQNVVKGGHPSLSRILEAGQEKDEVLVTGRDVSITGRDLGPSSEAEDEGVWLADLKTGEKVSVAEIVTSNLAEVVVTFPDLPSPGRYRLTVATRAGFAAEYKVVTAEREIAVSC